MWCVDGAGDAPRGEHSPAPGAGRMLVNLARASAQHLTTSRGPRDEALHASGALTVDSRWKKQSGVRNSRLKTQNSKLREARRLRSRDRRTARTGFTRAEVGGGSLLLVRRRAFGPVDSRASPIERAGSDHGRCGSQVGDVRAVSFAALLHAITFGAGRHSPVSVSVP